MKYSYNDNAFNKPDEQCCYFLGFLFADGCLSDNGRITINLSNKDVEILENFKKYLETEKPIFFYKKTNSCELSFSNKNILIKLIEYGLTPRKSLTLIFPKNIPNNMMRHFIRGYFDGDGCISKLTGVNTLRLRINFVGTYEFLSTLQTILMNELDINWTKITNMTTNKNTFQLNIKSIKDVESIKHYLYYKSTIYLKRKKRIFFTNIKIKTLNNKTTSKYKNVLYRKRTNSWSIMYYVDKKRIEKSGFKTEKEGYTFLKKMGINNIPI
jgi:hypothetical protein